MRVTGIKMAAISLMLLLGVVTSQGESKSLSGSVSLNQEAYLNDVKIRPGNYQVRFDAETNEVSILKDNHVIATAKARVQNGEKKPRQTAAYLSSTAKGMMLAKLFFKGDERAIIIGEGN